MTLCRLEHLPVSTIILMFYIDDTMLQPFAKSPEQHEARKNIIQINLQKT